ncbi:hypothetical protein [Snodgrassella alvi]|uniref:Uncharacterized protein n=1 Tax=Snodgrassella alvi TaxID=1196083 RepID=A0A2N9X986_9NEIS|nr:hypothetical protein [Snodgrassella alvi]PIT41408.1 hypothetical protein BHC54_01260 [Snodgrassella alvi]
MGTSQSSRGPNGDSPLIPPWADDKPHDKLPEANERRFKGFRQSFGRALSNGNSEDLKKALGYYASTATGGAETIARRFGSINIAGAKLFRVLAELSTENVIDLNSLKGKPCNIAISTIIQVLAGNDGDSEIICRAMDIALSEALVGMEYFDSSKLTFDIIVHILINYITNSILLQIILDAGKAWDKSDNIVKRIEVENNLRELIKVVVDQNLAPRISNNSVLLSQQQIYEFERQTIKDVWKIWENYI